MSPSEIAMHPPSCPRRCRSSLSCVWAIDDLPPNRVRNPTVISVHVRALESRRPKTPTAWRPSGHLFLPAITAPLPLTMRPRAALSPGVVLGPLFPTRGVIIVIIAAGAVGSFHEFRRVVEPHGQLIFLRTALAPRPSQKYKWHSKRLDADGRVLRLKLQRAMRHV